MDDRSQHHHRCANPDCAESWICQRADCGDDLCDACERRRFEAYMDRHGFTVSQPAIPELENV